MFDINDKLFGYISKSNEMNTNIIQRYKNSLIFIGDEKQIYIPTTNSYVGIGLSYFNEVLNNRTNNINKIYIKNIANNSLANPNTTYYFPVISGTTPNSYYYTYVALNVGVDPVHGKFIGGLKGTADYSTVSQVSYKNTVNSTNTDSTYYISFTNKLSGDSYTYVNSNLQYNPNTNTLIATTFKGDLDGRAKYATYATYSTYTTYTTYALFNSYQSVHRIDDNSNYYITFGKNLSYSLSYIDDRFFYNPSLNSLHADHFYGTFHGDTDMFNNMRLGTITTYNNTIYQENTYVKIGNTERGTGESAAYIITYLDGDLTSTSDKNLQMYVNINRIPINKELTYLHATYLGNVTKEGLFTEFKNNGNQTTKITIGGTSYTLKIDADKLDGFEASSLFQTFSGGGLTSSNNTLTQSEYTIQIGNTTKKAGQSSVNIINSANWSYVGSTSYIPNTAYNLILRYKVNGIDSSYAYIPKVYAYSATYIDGKLDFTNLPNLYWANIPLQNQSDSTKTPTFGKVTINGDSPNIEIISTNSSSSIYFRPQNSTQWTIGKSPWGNNGFGIGLIEPNGCKFNILDNGNVGIGVINPSQKLEVDGDIRIKGNDEYLGTASGSQCHMQYDDTNKCLNFIFD